MEKVHNESMVNSKVGGDSSCACRQQRQVFLMASCRRLVCAQAHLPRSTPMTEGGYEKIGSVPDSDPILGSTQTALVDEDQAKMSKLAAATPDYALTLSPRPLVLCANAILHMSKLVSTPMLDAFANCPWVDGWLWALAVFGIFIAQSQSTTSDRPPTAPVRSNVRLAIVRSHPRDLRGPPRTSFAQDQPILRPDIVH